MSRGLFALALATLTACASPPIRWASTSDFMLTIADNPPQQRFDLTLTSSSSEPLCLPKEAWPMVAGVPAGFDGAAVITSRGKMDLLPTGSAYCPGGCGDLRVEPGQSVRGILHYSAFGSTNVIANDPARELIFEVHPYVCSN